MLFNRINHMLRSKGVKYDKCVNFLVVTCVNLLGPSIPSPQLVSAPSNSIFVQTWSTITGSLSTTHREIREQGVQRAFLKDVDKNDDPDQYRMAHFLTKVEPNDHQNKIRKYFSSILQFIPIKLGGYFNRGENYKFSPVHGITYNTFQRPIEWISLHFQKRKRTPTLFLSFIVSFGAVSFTYDQFDIFFMEKLVESVQSEITAYGSEYDYLIIYDYRYKDIKNLLLKGNINKDQARRMAYGINQLFRDYYNYREEETASPSIETELRLVSNPLFIHLQDLIHYGVKKMGLDSGYFIPESAVGPLKESQIMALFQNSHHLFLKYELISEMVKNSRIWAQAQKSPIFQTICEEILQDPFLNQLNNLVRENKLSRDEMRMYLQEDAYWQRRFQDSKVLGISRLEAENGSFDITRPLTLADIRNEILNEISSH